MPSGKSNIHPQNKEGAEPNPNGIRTCWAIIWVFYRPAHIYLGPSVPRKARKVEKGGKSAEWGMLLSLMAVVVLYACVCVYVYLAKQLWQRKLTVYDFCQPRSARSRVCENYCLPDSHSHAHTHAADNAPVVPTGWGMVCFQRILGLEWGFTQVRTRMTVGINGNRCERRSCGKLVI